MAKRVLDRPFTDVVRNPLIPHDRFLPDREFTGLWEVAWHVPLEHPVSIGSGRFRLGEGGLVGEIARDAAGRPVLPGASLKGAIRQVFEFLTPSCEPGGPDSCRARPSDDSAALCPACGLFGAPGYGGRLSVLDATSETGEAVRATASVRRAPAPWPPHRAVPQTIRVYDRARASYMPPGQRVAVPSREVEAHDAASGTFVGRLRIVNASRLEIGVLLMATGVGAPLVSDEVGGAPPGLRVGGKKFHGWGEASAELRAVQQRYPVRQVRADAVAALDWWHPIFEAQVAKGDNSRLNAWKELLASWAAS